MKSIYDYFINNIFLECYSIFLSKLASLYRPTGFKLIQAYRFQAYTGLQVSRDRNTNYNYRLMLGRHVMCTHVKYTCYVYIRDIYMLYINVIHMLFIHQTCNTCNTLYTCYLPYAYKKIALYRP